MKNEPLVSVIIPTYNSEKTFTKCLKSIKNQTYQNIEVIVVDSHSSDNTREIAEKLSVKILDTSGKLLGARYKGLKESEGEYLLMLDSDQILENTAVERALGMFVEYDMLCLEEHSYYPRTWVQKLFDADRRLVHDLANVHLDPLEGVLLARFYKREILEKAFEAIPEKIIPIIVAHDHAIIYYEAYIVPNKVGILPNAVWHIEPASLVELWKKNYRYGKTTKELIEMGFYQDLLKKKVRFRRGALRSGNLKHGLSSYVLLMLKGIAYQMGYYV